MAEQSADLMREVVRAYLPLLIRLLRGIQYVGLTSAGVLLLSKPTALLQTSMGQIVYGWAAFLVLGGSLCTVGTATKIWAGEFTGLTLLITANAVWGGALIGAGGNSAKYGMVLVAWSFGLAAREGQILEKVWGAAGVQKQRRRARRRRDG
jgi:hypothetical protein